MKRIHTLSALAFAAAAWAVPLHAQPLKIAVIDAMTGPAGQTGINFSEGVTYGVMKLNEASGFGGEKIVLTGYDNLNNPRVLLVDEPTEGLAPKIVEHLVAVIGDIHRRGVAVLLVEQKMTIAMRLAQRCLIMGKGRIVFDGTPEAIRQDDALRRAWLEVA